MKISIPALFAIAVTLSVSSAASAEGSIYPGIEVDPWAWPAPTAPQGESRYQRRMRALDRQLRIDRQNEIQRGIDLQNRWQRHNDAIRRGQQPGWRPPTH